MVLCRRRSHSSTTFRSTPPQVHYVLVYESLPKMIRTTVNYVCSTWQSELELADLETTSKPETPSSQEQRIKQHPNQKHSHHKNKYLTKNWKIMSKQYLLSLWQEMLDQYLRVTVVWFILYQQNFEAEFHIFSSQTSLCRDLRVKKQTVTLDHLFCRCPPQAWYVLLQNNPPRSQCMAFLQLCEGICDLSSLDTRRSPPADSGHWTKRLAATCEIWLGILHKPPRNCIEPENLHMTHGGWWLALADALWVWCLRPKAKVAPMWRRRFFFPNAMELRWRKRWREQKRHEETRWNHWWVDTTGTNANHNRF